MVLEIGSSAQRSRTITASDILAFADAVDDHNPVHVDEKYAAATQFGQRIAHGMLGASLISSALANDLPGPGSIYLGQTLKFKKPVYIGDTITVSLVCTSYRERSRVATFSTNVTNQHGEIVIEGEATVIAPEAG